MPTSYTSILKLALPATGELSGTWGDVVNNNITSMVEEAIAGLALINTWTANSHTLTTANGVTSESRCAILIADDNGGGQPSAAATIICPAVSKTYILRNISGQAVTLKTSGGTGISVANNTTATLFCDGTNVVSASEPRYIQLIAVPATTAIINGNDIVGAVESPLAGTVTNLRAKTTTGTCTVDFKKGGVSMGTVAATSSGVNNASPTNNTVAALDDFTFDVTSASGSGLVVTITIQG